MKIKLLALFDYFIIFSVLILITIGILFIYSSAINSNGVLISNEYIKQIVFAVTGLVILITMSIIDYRKLRPLAGYMYAGLILLLVYTRLFGKYVNGARSWLGIGDFGIQPSVFGVVVFTLFLAWYLDISDKTQSLKRFVVATMITLLPVCLILLQPDLGTSLVYIPIFLVMCFVADVPLRYIMAVFLFGTLVLLFTILPIWQRLIYRQPLVFIQVFTNIRLRFFIILALSIVGFVGVAGLRIFRQRYFFWIAYFFLIISLALLVSIVTERILKEYQIMRLIVFIDPYIDRLGFGWNIIQSKIAIGSGNLLGQGYLSGTQSHYRFLPEQSTDFIFSILSEEWGFVGGISVFVLYAIILGRGLAIIRGTANNFGYYVGVGLIFMFFFHFVINVGMVMGIMPITGLPLIFVSYGGSSLWTGMASVGILISIHLRRMDFSD